MTKKPHAVIAKYAVFKELCDSHHIVDRFTAEECKLIEKKTMQRSLSIKYQRSLTTTQKSQQGTLLQRDRATTVADYKGKPAHREFRFFEDKKIVLSLYELQKTGKVDLNASSDSIKQLKKEVELEQWMKQWHKCSDLGEELRKFLGQRTKDQQLDPEAAMLRVASLLAYSDLKQFDKFVDLHMKSQKYLNLGYVSWVKEKASQMASKRFISPLDKYS